MESGYVICIDGAIDAWGDMHHGQCRHEQRHSAARVIDAHDERFGSVVVEPVIQSVDLAVRERVDHPYGHVARSAYQDGLRRDHDTVTKDSPDARHPWMYPLCCQVGAIHMKSIEKHVDESIHYGRR